MLGKKYQCSFDTAPQLVEALAESGLLKEEYRKLLEPVIFKIDDELGQKIITIHKNYLSNGNSLPKLAKVLLDKWLGSDTSAYILHDFLSEYLMVLKDGKYASIDRTTLADIFVRSLDLTKLNKLQKFIIWVICKVAAMFDGKYKSTFNSLKQKIETCEVKNLSQIA